MATNKTTVELEVLAKGLDEAIVKAKSLRDIMLEAGKAASSFRVPGAVAAAREGVAASNAGRSTYRAAAAAPAGGSTASDTNLSRSIGGLTGAEGRDFGKQAQGLGGLVHVYATFAANIFAVSAAFNALSAAMDTSNLVKGLDQLGASSGRNLGTVAKNLALVSEGSISLREAATATALASAGGMTTSQIQRMGVVAKNASQALGVAMPDAINRLSKGIVKIQPELLDELGIMTRVIPAHRAYAQSVGKSIEQLSDFEKRQAFANAVLTEGEDKFSSINLEANNYSRILASMANIVQGSLEKVNSLLSPIVGLLASSPLALGAAMFALFNMLLRMGLPALKGISQGMFEAKEKAVEAARVARQGLADIAGAKLQQNTSPIAMQYKDANKALDEHITKLKDVQGLNKSTNAYKAISAIDIEDPNSIIKAQAASKVRLKDINDQVLASKYRDAAHLDALNKESIKLKEVLTLAGDTAQLKAAQVKTATEYNKLSSGDLTRSQKLAQLEVNRTELALKQANILKVAGENLGTHGPTMALTTGIGQIVKTFKETDGAIAKTNAAMTGLWTGAKLGALVTADAIKGIGVAFNSMLGVIGIIIATIGIIDTIFGSGAKEATAFTSSIDGLDSSTKSFKDTYNTLSKKNNSKIFNIEATQAQANALNDLSEQVKKVVLDFEAVQKATGLWSGAIDALWSIIGKGNSDKLSSGLGAAIINSIGSLNTNKLKKEYTEKLEKSFNVDLTTISTFKDSLAKLSSEDRIKAIEGLGAVIEDLSTKANTSAAILSGLAESFKETAKLVQTTNAELLPQDYFSKISRSLRTDADKMGIAIREPINGLKALQEIFKNPEIGSLFSTADYANIQEYEKQLAELGNSFGALEKEKLKLNKSETATKMGDSTGQNYGRNIGAIVLGSIAAVAAGVVATPFLVAGGFSVIAGTLVAGAIAGLTAGNTGSKFGEAIGGWIEEALIDPLAKSRDDIEATQEKLTKKAVSLVEEAGIATIKGMRAAAAEAHIIATKNAQEEMAREKVKSQAGMIKAAGGDTTKIELSASLQELNYQKTVIEAQYKSQLAMEGNTSSTEALTVSIDRLNNNIILSSTSKDITEADRFKARADKVLIDKRGVSSEINSLLQKKPGTLSPADSVSLEYYKQTNPREIEAGKARQQGKNELLDNKNLALAKIETKAQVLLENAVLSSLTYQQKTRKDNLKYQEDALQISLKEITAAQAILGTKDDQLSISKNKIELDLIGNKFDQEAINNTINLAALVVAKTSAQKDVANGSKDAALVLLEINETTAKIKKASGDLELRRTAEIRAFNLKYKLDQQKWDLDRKNILLEIFAVQTSTNLDAINAIQALTTEYSSLFQAEKSINEQKLLQITSDIALNNLLKEKTDAEIALATLKKNSNINNVVQTQLEIDKNNTIIQLQARIDTVKAKNTIDLQILKSKGLKIELDGIESVRKKEADYALARLIHIRELTKNIITQQETVLGFQVSTKRITEEGGTTKTFKLAQLKIQQDLAIARDKYNTDTLTANTENNNAELKATEVKNIKLKNLEASYAADKELANKLKDSKNSEDIILLGVINTRMKQEGDETWRIARAEEAKVESLKISASNYKNIVTQLENTLESATSTYKTNLLSLEITKIQSIEQSKINKLLSDQEKITNDIASISKSLADSFGERGAALGSYIEQYRKSQTDQYANEIAFSDLKRQTDRSDAQAASDQREYDAKSLQNRLDGYMALISAAKNLMGVNSTWGKILTVVQKVTQYYKLYQTITSLFDKKDTKSVTQTELDNVKRIGDLRIAIENTYHTQLTKNIQERLDAELSAIDKIAAAKGILEVSNKGKPPPAPAYLTTQRQGRAEDGSVAAALAPIAAAALAPIALLGTGLFALKDIASDITTFFTKSTNSGPQSTAIVEKVVTGNLATATAKATDEVLQQLGVVRDRAVILAKQVEISAAVSTVQQSTRAEINSRDIASSKEAFLADMQKIETSRQAREKAAINTQSDLKEQLANSKTNTNTPYSEMGSNLPNVLNQIGRYAIEGVKDLATSTFTTIASILAAPLVLLAAPIALLAAKPNPTVTDKVVATANDRRMNDIDSMTANKVNITAESASIKASETPEWDKLIKGIKGVTNSFGDMGKKVGNMMKEGLAKFVKPLTDQLTSFMSEGIKTATDFLIQNPIVLAAIAAVYVATQWDDLKAQKRKNPDPTAEELRKVQGTGMGYNSDNVLTATGTGALGNQEAQNLAITNSLDRLGKINYEMLQFTKSQTYNALLSIKDNTLNFMKAFASSGPSLSGIQQGIETGTWQSNLKFSTRTVEILDVGVRVNATLKEIAEGLGDFVTYTTTKVTGSSFWGLVSRAPKTFDNPVKMEASMREYFSNAVLAVRKVIEAEAESFGTTALELAPILDVAKIELAVSKGTMSNSEYNAAILATLGNELDKITIATIPGIEKLYKEFGTLDESIGEFALRIDDDRLLIQNAFKSIGQAYKPLLDDTTKLGAVGNRAAEQSLIKLFGTDKDFKAAIDKYDQSILTAEQRLKPIREAVNTQLLKLFPTLESGGKSLITTREQFDTLRLSIDANNPATQGLWSALTILAPAFATVTAETVKLTEAELNKAKNSQLVTILQLRATDANDFAAKALTLTRQAELDTMDELLKPTQRYIYALQDEATIKGKLKTAYDAANTAVKATITSLKSSIQSLKDYRQNLFTGDKANLTPIEKYTADKQTFMQLAQAAAVVLGSDATTEQVAARDKALGALAGASDAFLASSKVVFASSAAYQEDFSSVAGVLNSTQAILETQQTDAEKNLAILQSSDAYLGIIDESTRTTATLMEEFLVQQRVAISAAAIVTAYTPSTLELEISKLPNTLLSLTNSIDKLAINMYNLPASFTTALALTATTKVPTSTEARIAEPGTLTAGTPGTVTTASGFTAATSVTYADVEAQRWRDKGYVWDNNANNWVPAHAKGGIAYGQSLVGEQGPELVDFVNPARVYTARDTNLFGDNTAIIKELQELRKELSQLRQDQQEQTGHLITTNYDANIKAAGKVASATEDATEKAVWLQKSVATIK